MKRAAVCNRIAAAAPAAASAAFAAPLIELLLLNARFEAAAARARAQPPRSGVRKRACIREAPQQM